MKECHRPLQQVLEVVVGPILTLFAGCYLGFTGAVRQIINTNPSILGGGRQFVQGGAVCVGVFSQLGPHCLAANTPTCHEEGATS